MISPSGHAESQDQRVVLHDVDWAQFEHWLKMRGENGSVRITYAEGDLELMSPSAEHELDVRDIDRLFATFSDETGVELACSGSVTLKNKLLAKGAEPDTCYFINRKRAGMPDLAIEVVWTSTLSALKLAAYWALGVKEVWTWSRSDGFVIHRRKNKGWSAGRRSDLLTDLDLELLARFIGTDNPSRAARRYRAALRKSFSRRG